MSKMSDIEKIEFLRGMELMVGWTPGTEFEKATVKLEMNRGEDVLDYFLMSEIIELHHYFMKLSAMISLGHVVSVSDKFAYQILSTNGVFKAFSALAEATRE